MKPEEAQDLRMRIASRFMTVLNEQSTRGVVTAVVSTGLYHTMSSIANEEIAKLVTQEPKQEEEKSDAEGIEDIIEKEPEPAQESA